MYTVFIEVYSTITYLHFFIFVFIFLMTSFTSNTGGRQYWCLLLFFKSAQTVAIRTVGHSEFRKYNRANQFRHSEDLHLWECTINLTLPFSAAVTPSVHRDDTL